MPLRLLKQSAICVLTFIICCPVTDCLAATIANEMSIPDTITQLMLTKETVGDEIKKCLGASEVDKKILSHVISRLSQDTSGTLQNDNGYFVHRGTIGYCIQKSVNGYPVFAPEAFYDTVNPADGVPSSTVDEWYKNIATLIARKGRAKVAYVFDVGNAVVAEYSTENADIVYSDSFKKSGEWESDSLDAIFRYKTMETYTVSRYGGKFIKSNLLAHRNKK